MRIDLEGKFAAGSCASAGLASRKAARTALLMSLRLHAGSLYALAPALDVALDLGGELLGRVRDRVDAVSVEALEEVGPPDDRDRVVVDLLHDVARRRRRRHEAVPRGDVEAGQRLGDRRNVGQRLGALRARDAERLEL